jgi:hypothetical protein
MEMNGDGVSAILDPQVQGQRVRCEFFTSCPKSGDKAAVYVLGAQLMTRNADFERSRRSSCL